MKILNITLKNLNSLRGEHTIDMANGPLTHVGLFAITGPTGSGKSTILDAISLALYGRAARYDKPNPEDMMSRHCGECTAEVLFEVPSGTYRAQWQLRRARGKADGNIQPANRYIYDAEGNVLCEKIREADDLIESLIGLDYERFLRSVMLAQGEFARFLKAKANERAELLESLTGTIIYSELSRLAHTEATRREDELEQKEQDLGQIQILEEEERKEIASNIKAGKKQRTELEITIKKNSKTIQNIDSLIQTLEQEGAATSAIAVIVQEITDAEKDLKKLSRHQLTLSFSENLVNLTHAEDAVNTHKDRLAEAEETHQEAVQTQLETTAQYRAKLITGVNEQNQRVQELETLVTQAKATVEEKQTWLETHKIDENLEDNLNDLVASLTELKSWRNELSRSRTDLLKTTEKLSDLQVAFPETFEDASQNALKNILEDITRKLQKNKIKADARVEIAELDLNTKQNEVQKSRIIASFDDHRAELVSGEPCLLCGSTDHPYADGQEPDLPFEKLQTAVDEATENLEKKKDVLREVDEALSDLQGKTPGALQLIDNWQDKKGDLTESLKQYQVKLPAEGEEDQLRTQLQDRAQAYEDHTEALKEAQGIIQSASESKDQAQTQHDAWQTWLKELGDPSSEEQDLELEADDKSLPQAREEWQAANAEVKSCKATLKTATSDHKAANVKLDQVTQKIKKALEPSVFHDIPELRSARLSQEEYDLLTELETDLNTRKSEQNTRLTVAKEQIETLRQKETPEGEEAEQIKDQQQELQEQRDTLIESLNTWRNQIETDNENQKKLEEGRKALEEERAEVAIWSRLRALIGSASGDKFRKYAQSISLDILVQNANKHLAQLSDRYCIKRIVDAELELEIEDQHQASVTRPMASLSGGESFLTSLSLALGLSELAGRNVQIESLFIDEGFGTLDSDSLDLAIGTLESLQQNSKSVGVISHVELLKQRITTQIQVEKQTAGISTLKIVS